MWRSYGDIDKARGCHASGLGLSPAMPFCFFSSREYGSGKEVNKVDGMMLGFYENNL